MPRRAKRQAGRLPITAAEFRIMDAIWKLGRATVADVERTLKHKLAYTTIMTMLRSLERKGFVTHNADGRTFVYTPVVDRKNTRQGVLDHLRGAFFDGSRNALMLHLVDESTHDEKTRARLRALLMIEKLDT
ncbi:MAG: BlaI/MecI/CopY family transcriptional regulator [Candidatus Eremiobacteraeota bacterium]|nr:BlaI/MecI/CopY family transcriptional regulator [Candidatus Eremiobacteraeota bacterium]